MNSSRISPIRSGSGPEVDGIQPRPSSARDEAAREVIPPYGGTLVDLLVNTPKAEELKRQSRDWPSWELTPRQLCDLELLLNGGFSPLQGFLAKADYERVCREMRLTDGTMWPIPVVLDVSESFASKVGVGSKVALRDPEGVMLAILTVEDLWQPDRVAEAELVYGTGDTHHAGVRFLLEHVGQVYLGGKVEGVQLPHHHDFEYLRQTPRELREKFRGLGWNRVIAFQTRNPMHQAHFRMTLHAAQEHGANLLIHPVTGMTKPGDVDHFCRVRCYQALLPRYPANLAALSLLPLSMRMAGPREAVWHAIIRRNYGCSHLIVGRDHGGPGQNASGRPFYAPYAAQEPLLKHESELGTSHVPFSTMVYCPVRKEHLPDTHFAPGAKTMDLSGTELRNRLAHGHEIPEWFTFAEVAAELRKTYPPRSQQGFTIFFTGLSGSGKSTLAKGLLDKLLEIGGRPVTLLDGDIVRKNLSSELGFSREHRNLNILRIGFVANEITKNRGVAICAPIAPYEDIRQQVRQLISSRGGFILIHLSTPLEVCEQRDRKGLYAKARAGIVKEFTGVSDPYEAPTDAEVVLNTAELGVAEGCQAILNYLEKEGYLVLPNQCRAAQIQLQNLIPTMNPEPQPPPLRFNNSAESQKGEPGSLPERLTGLDPDPKREGSPPGSPGRPLIRQGAARGRWPSLGNAISRRFWRLDGEKLCAEARRRTGLENFGDPPLEPALSILARSLEEEAELHPLGRFLMRVHLRGLLEMRLRLTAAWSGHESRLDACRIQQPVFIIGMPRTGSTYLHELLAEDPDNRAPRVWEVMFPLPLPGSRNSHGDRRVRRAAACLWAFRQLAPEADAVYPMRAWTPHECVAIQSYTLLSEEFISTCRIPSYETFLHAAQLEPAYAWEKRFLQHLQLDGPAKRWVLKSPDHVQGLEALFSVFPDAVIIQTHRNPLEVVKSSIQLTQVLHKLYAREGDHDLVAQREARVLAERMERFIRFRETHPELAGRIVDVKYSELVSDPLAVVRRIYGQFELPLSEVAIGRMGDLALNRSRYRPHQAPRTLADFGLDPAVERQRFERYCTHFDIPCQPAGLG